MSAPDNGTWLSFRDRHHWIAFCLLSTSISLPGARLLPGSLYTYIVKGLGPIAGVLSGWALLLGLHGTGMSTLCGFAIFGQILLAQIGIHSPILLLFALGVIVSYGVAYKDVQLSAKMMLIFEGVSIFIVLVLGIVIWAHKGFRHRHGPSDPARATPGGVITGIVLVIFGFSGFESSTSLGAEAKDPLRTIPRSLLQSTAALRALFPFMAYVIVLAFKGSGAIWVRARRRSPFWRPGPDWVFWDVDQYRRLC